MDNEHRVVIIGGGFGGLFAARALKRTAVRVTLIDRRNFHLFQPLLYQVAVGGLSPANIASPLFQDRSRRFDQMGADLLEELAALPGRQRLDQTLFGGGQNARQADQEQIADQIRADGFRLPAHVFLLEPYDPFADGGFDFTLRFHVPNHKLSSALG